MLGALGSQKLSLKPGLPTQPADNRRRKCLTWKSSNSGENSDAAGGCLIATWDVQGMGSIFFWTPQQEPAASDSSYNYNG